MPLSKEIYKEFEAIVGKRYISNDTAVLDTYTYLLSHTSLHMGPAYDVYTPRGLAVLLPSCVEEVQAIIKLCNKYKFQAKASSTFWSAMGFPSQDDSCIQIDMRRMDKILEIDEKNMYAVIEPGVIGASLQAETIKRGLNAHIHGPGCSCSCLASATSYSGMGPDGIFLGVGIENMLGVEWVMPNGEILRTGTLGSGQGWFYGEGPGPAGRALVRGAYGGKGAAGVFTKCALKLSAWPGPDIIPVEGTVPAYRAKLPDNFRGYTLGFSTWEGFADASYKIWDAGIGYIAHRQFNMFGRDLKYGMIKILTDPTKTFNDLEELLKEPEVQKANEDMIRDFQLVLVGQTQRDIEWQDKALDIILEATGGFKVQAMEVPDIKEWALMYLIRLGHKNLNCVYAGGYDGNGGLVGIPDFGTRHIEELGAYKKEWEEKGNIVLAGGDCAMGGIATYGGGGVTVWENFTCFDPYDRESTQGTWEFFEADNQNCIDKGWGSGMQRANAACRDIDGYATKKEKREAMLKAGKQPNTHRYQKKIQETFDPNTLGDAYYSVLSDD